MRFKRTPSEKLRVERLKTLPPLAMEFQQLMGEVFGDASSAIAPAEMQELRTRAAALARTILGEIEELRWDQHLSGEVRMMLEATKRRMLTDNRVKGLLRDTAAPRANPT